MNKKFSLFTGISLVVANMVGTGVFTSLGFQLLDITDFSSILILWICGGIISLFGAFAYAELGAAMPMSGGEYNFLSRIYHPSVGFLSGWISATIGFAAPIALAAASLGAYFKEVVPWLSPTYTAIGIIVLVTILQSFNYSIGGGFQKIATLVKIVLLTGFIICGLFSASQGNITFLPTEVTGPNVFSLAFAASMYFVSFAYSGWNASAYIAGEIENPSRSVPLSLLIGTSIVTVLYVGLNFVFLKVAPVNELKVIFTETGPTNIDTGYIAGKYIFGESGALVVSVVISLLLVSTISAMIIAGPRVISAMGNNFSVFKMAGITNKSGIPVYAIWFQSVLSIIILLSGKFDTILFYTSFVLILFSSLTVIGVVILRIKEPGLNRPYKTWGYPFTPIIFLLANIWFMYKAYLFKPNETYIGLGIVGLGIIVYFVVARLSRPYKTNIS